MICSVPDCGRKVLAKSLCQRHYHRAREGVPVDGRPTMCRIEGCGRKIVAHGLCKMHYTRMKRHGDPLVTLRAPKHEPWKFYREIVLSYTGTECLFWPYSRNHYGWAVIARPGTNAGTIYVGRQVCADLIGPPPSPRHQSAHRCGNGHLGCVAPAHLRWDTPVGNNADKIGHGTNGVKLTVEQVREIRALKGAMTAAEIGAKYGISAGSARDTYNRKTWRNLP